MQRKFLPLTLVLAALFGLLAAMGFRTLTETTPAICLAEEEKRVYLTFDDGPSTVVTGRVLDILKRENVKATFFIVSDRVEGREKTLKRITAEGHAAGVHSASHEYSKIYASDEAFLKDVETCASVIRNVTGIGPDVYRFPGGGMSSRKHFEELLRARGYRVVGWNAVCGDEEIPRADARTLFEETVKTSQGKRNVVLLLHDSAHHKATAEALPDIIRYYRENGYTFCRF